MRIEVSVSNTIGVTVVPETGDPEASRVTPSVSDLWPKFHLPQNVPSINRERGLSLSRLGTNSGPLVLTALTSRGFTREQIARGIAEIYAEAYQAFTAPVVATVSLSSIAPGRPVRLPPREGVFIIDGALYRLSFIRDAEGADALQVMQQTAEQQQQTLQQSYTQSLIQNAQEIDRRVREVERRLTQGRLPPIPFEMVRDYGLLAWTDGRYSIFSLPFEYRPWVLLVGNRYMKLNDDMVSTLHRDIRINFRVDGIVIRDMTLVNADMVDEFHHYHIGCWGTYRPPDVQIPEGLLRVRDELQILLECINDSSIASRAPDGLRAISAIRDSRTGEEVDASALSPNRDTVAAVMRTPPRTLPEPTGEGWRL